MSTPNLVITSSGLNSIANADEGGFKLSVKTFKISSFVYSADESLASTMRGTPFYTGTVSSVEVLSDSSVRYELTIPVGVPTTGTAIIGELGLYLESGELFATGKILPAITKDSTTGFNIYTIVAAAKLGVTVDVTVSDKANISRTNVDILSDPKSSGTNTLAVSDAHQGYEVPYKSASLAIKFGPFDDEWSFVGFTKVAKTEPDSILSRRSFQINPSLKGFWLNDGESVLVQIVTGSGAGETKRFKYNKSLYSTNNVFESASDFTEFASDSILNIWRDSAIVYPDRRGVPASQVLFAGESTHSSTWDTGSPIAGTLKLKSLYFTSVNNQYLYVLPNNLPKSYQDKNNILLFIDGVLQSFNDFNIYDNNLITSPAVGVKQVSMYVFYREDSNGSAFKLYEELIEFAALVDYNGKPSYNLPIVPSSVEDSLGFSFAGQLGLELPHDWTFEGARIVFNTKPDNDTLLLVYGSEEITSGYSQPKQYEWLYNKNNNDSSTNTHVFKLSDTPTDLSFVLFAKGSVVPKRLYTIANNEIRISKSDLGLAEGDYIRFLWVINKLASSYADTSVTSVKVNATPNKLVPHVSTFITPAVSFAVADPINDNYILVFVKGLKQEKDVDWKLQGTNEIVLLGTVPDDFPVDIVTFSEETDSGFILNSYIHNVTTIVNQAYYSVPYHCSAEDNLIVFVDGIYLHKSMYAMTNQTPDSFDIQLLSTMLPPNCDLEFVIFNSEELAESRTDLILSKPVPHIGFRKFEIESGSVLQQNTLMFIGPVYQHKSTYQVRDNEITLDRSVPYSILDPLKYGEMSVELLSFVSGRDLVNINLELAALAQTVKPARNTGPYWADPAGTNRSPNRMAVSVATFTTSASTKFIFTPPYNSSNILVFVHGALQNKDRDYVFLSLGQIAFTSKLPDGYPVDVITFQSVEDPVGYELDMKVFEIISNNTNNYTVNYNLTDEQNLLVFVEGVYFHRSWYKVVANGNKFNIQFNQGLINDLRVEACIWNQVESENSYTEMLVQLPNPTIGAKNIVLTEPVTRKNTLVFAGPIYQSKSTYKVNELTLQLDTAISYEYVDPINFKDMPVTICSFRTGASKSRLITRDELRDNYMTRHGGDLKGPLYTVGDPESDLEVANKRYVDTIKSELDQMRSIIASMQGMGNAGTYSPVLAIAPNLIKVNDVTTIRITNAPPGKSVELEVRGSSGVYNARSIKGLVKLDGTFTIGPVGVDNGYSDYLTITAWVDGFRVPNTADVKVTDGSTISGPAMISSDKEIYAPYDYITYSIADGTPGGKVTWGINGATATAVPAGQQQYVSTDGTWSMQVPAGGVPTNYIIELFVDSLSVGTLNIIVSPSRTETLPSIKFNTSELYRDEVVEIQIANAKTYAPVTFSAKAIGLGRSGPTDTAGLINTAGELNFGMRFTSPGDYIIYITINRNLFTHTLKVKQVSPTDVLITEQTEGYRAYIKQY